MRPTIWCAAAAVLVASQALANDPGKSKAMDTQANQAEKTRSGSQQANTQMNQERAQQGAQAQQAMEATPFQQLTEKTKGVMAHITAATVALQNDQKQDALSALRMAETTLAGMYGVQPGASFIQKLDQATRSALNTEEGGGPIDFAPIMAEVQSYQIYLDPKTVANIEKAQKQVQKGQRAEAAESLMLARSSAVTELAFLPVDDAYARVVAARTLVNEGKLDAARQVLSSVPVTVAVLEARSPYVAARFNLQAAAAAAEQKDWDRADKLVNSAAEQFQNIPQENLDKEMKPVVDRVRRLQRRVDQGEKPSPSEFRNLAKRIQDGNVG